MIGPLKKAQLGHNCRTKNIFEIVKFFLAISLLILKKFEYSE